MEIAEALMKVGFTRQESLLYLTLCREGPLTGYEAAKSTGISRSNAYLALAGLVEKGAAYRSEGETVKFIPVPAAELTRRLRDEFGRVLDFIAANAPPFELPREPFITIDGRNAIIRELKDMLHIARERIYLAADPVELDGIMTELAAAVDRGLKVVVITTPPWNLKGATVYYHSRTPGQLRLIVDSASVLTGELTRIGHSACIFSRNRNLVQLIKDSLTNELELIGRKNRRAEAPEEGGASYE